MNISDFFVDFTTEKLASPDVFLCPVVYAWCSTSVTPTHWPLLREATPGWPAAHDQRHTKETQHDPRPRKGHQLLPVSTQTQAWAPLGQHLHFCKWSISRVYLSVHSSTRMPVNSGNFNSIDLNTDMAMIG